MSEEKLHLIKLCVGADSIDDLIEWRTRSLEQRKKAGQSAHMFHTTRMWPRHEAELLSGGSLFWVVKGLISVRQPIHGFEEVFGEDGIRRCTILLEPEFIQTELQPRRPFQGWRYLKGADAPTDLSVMNASIAPELASELSELGLL